MLNSVMAERLSHILAHQKVAALSDRLEILFRIFEAVRTKKRLRCERLVLHAARGITMTERPLAWSAFA